MNIALVTAALNFFTSLKREPKAHLLNADTLKGGSVLTALFVILGFDPVEASNLDQNISVGVIALAAVVDIFRRKYAAASESAQ